jgi:3-phenylpropionate/trans-cinnamate dioxygenase ferredoxin subunit
MCSTNERLFCSAEKMKLYNWHKIEGISAESLEENKLTETVVAQKRVGLLKRNNIIHAFSAMCPHAGASLCSGWLDALGRIVCPEHKYRFDPANGRNTSGEGYKLVTYPVELREDGIYIGFV